MITWVVEFEGEERPLDAIASEEFQAAVLPVRQIIETAVSRLDAEDLAGLKVAFWVDPDEGLKFTLRGPPVAVNLAVDAIGPLVSFPRAGH